MRNNIKITFITLVLGVIIIYEIMNTITIEIRWRVPVENQRKRTQEFFNNYQSIETDINIKEIFSFGHPNNKQPFVDVYINDRNGKNAYWAERLINALKEEKANIQTIHLYSKQKLEDMLESGIISTDTEIIPPTESYKYTVLL